MPFVPNLSREALAERAAPAAPPPVAWPFVDELYDYTQLIGAGKTIASLPPGALGLRVVESDRRPQLVAVFPRRQTTVERDRRDGCDAGAHTERGLLLLREPVQSAVQLVPRPRDGAHASLLRESGLQLAAHGSGAAWTVQGDQGRLQYLRQPVPEQDLGRLGELDCSPAGL